VYVVCKLTITNMATLRNLVVLSDKFNVGLNVICTKVRRFVQIIVITIILTIIINIYL
jgi:hypothetical protein